MSRNWRSGIGAVAAGLTLCACATLPPPTPARQARAPGAYQTTTAFAAPDADWPRDAWWRAYGDPQLDALIEEALAASPTLARVQARLVKAQASTAAATAGRLPTLALNGQVQELKQSYNNGIPAQFVPKGYNDVGRLSLDFDWELDFWGRNRAAVAAATSTARAAGAEAAEARLVLATGVAATYATLAQLFAERDLTAAAVKVREETVALVQRRVAGGEDTQGELDEAQAGPPAGRADLAALDEEIGRTRNALAALLGAGPDRGAAIVRPPTARLAAFGLPAHLAADLIGRRPDVAAARWRAEAATHQVAGARAAFYPNINLTAYVGLQALHLDQLVAPGSDIGAVGPALSLPIFEGGRLRADLRGARADRDEAVAAYDEAVTQALRDVADAAAGARALGLRLAASRQALAAGEGAWRIARLRYDGGLSNYQSVLLAEDAVLSERRAVSDLQSRALALDIALVRALGGGFTDRS